MPTRLLRHLLADGRLRSSGLPRLKSSRWVQNKLIERIVNGSPVTAHLLEDAYRLVLARVMRTEARADAAAIKDRLATFCRRFPGALGDSDEQPVFLLAAGWRSGSTLVQRVLMSDERLMIWGEPFARAGVVMSLLSQFRAFTDEWPPSEYFVSSQGAKLSANWIANSYPGAREFVAAHRSFLVELLAEPARARGQPVWGLKEVRLDGGHALYLKRLFPKARFVFLVRDPRAAFASFRHYIKSDFASWPERPIRSAGEFGRLWRELAMGLSAVCPEVGGLWLRYEDYLRDPALHRALCAHVDADLVPPDRLALIPSAGEIGASASARPANRLLWYERRGLMREVGDAARQLGYAV